MRVALLALHPAPYRDATFARVCGHLPGVEVLSVARAASNHSYWGLGAPVYRHVWLDEVAPADRFEARVARYLHAGRFDAILVPGHSHPAARAALAYASAARVPIVYSADTTEDAAPRSPLKTALLRALVKRAASLWVPGARSRHFFRSLGVSPDAIHEGCYALDPAALVAPAPRRLELRAALGIPAAAFVALFVGEMTPFRALPSLLAALAQTSGPNAPWLVLVGRGTERARAEAEVTRLRLERVRFVEPVPFAELPAIYAMADAYVHAGHEPYSLAVLQAAMQGLPIVSTRNVGAVDDCVIDGSTGLLCEEADVPAFARALQRLADGAEAARAMGARGKQLAQGRDPAWAAEQLERALRSAAATNRPEFAAAPRRTQAANSKPGRRALRVVLAGDWHTDFHEQAWADALESLGHTVARFPWFKRFSSSSATGKLVARAENKLLAGPRLWRLNRDLLDFVRREKPEVLLLYRGTHVTARTLAQLKREAPRLVIASYNNDDPFSPRASKLLWRHYFASIPLVDVQLVYRQKNLEELRRAGARRVFQLRSSFIPAKDHPVALTEEERARLACDVVFVGHYEDDGRLDFVRALVEAGVDLRIHGHEWHRVSEPWFQPFMPAGASFGAAYAKTISAAKIALCFLSGLNHDTYTRRCFEIPAIGALLLCQRTEEMQSMFAEGVDAEYFSTPAELVEKTRKLLSDDGLRTRIARSGHERVRRDGHDVDSRMRELERILFDALDPA